MKEKSLLVYSFYSVSFLNTFVSNNLMDLKEKKHKDILRSINNNYKMLWNRPKHENLINIFMRILLDC
jgi:hypothetical protein